MEKTSLQGWDMDIVLKNKSIDHLNIVNLLFPELFSNSKWSTN